MKNSMIVINRDGSKQHHICPACRIDYSANGSERRDENIPTYYSEKHAEDEGWRKTNHIMYCDLQHAFVWVCPDCWPGDAK